MANATCYDKDCDYEVTEAEETKFVGDFILTAGTTVATLFLLLALLLHSALF